MGPSQLTISQVRQQFEAEGVTVRDWARREGFDPAQVYQVLSGRVSCKRGRSHEIAQRLGIKPVVDARYGTQRKEAA